MQRLLVLASLLLAVPVFTCLAEGQATTTVVANPVSSPIGGAVGLTATVQADNASVSPGHSFAKPAGTISFLDGTAPLGGPVTLMPNGFSSTTFPPVFGTPDPAITTQNRL